MIYRADATCVRVVAFAQAFLPQRPRGLFLNFDDRGGILRERESLIDELRELIYDRKFVWEKYVR